jgi:hypothetical protein
MDRAPSVGSEAYLGPSDRAGKREQAREEGSIDVE